MEGLTLVESDRVKYYLDSQKRKQGLFIIFSQSSKSIRKIYNCVDNIFEGEAIQYFQHTNIVKCKGNFSKGLLNGKYIEYYESGNKKEKGNYINGKKDGEWFEYKNHENSIPQIKYYENGIECDPTSIQVKNARKKV